MSPHGRTFTRVHGNDSCSSRGHILGSGLLNFHRNESSLKYRFRPRSLVPLPLPLSLSLFLFLRFKFPPVSLSPARLKSLHNAVSPPNSRPSTECSMIKRKTCKYLSPSLLSPSSRDRYLTFFEIPSVTTKLVGTEKKGKAWRAGGGINLLRTSTVAPGWKKESPRSSLILRLFVIALARSFSFITARSSYRSNSEIRKWLRRSSCSCLHED